VKTLGRHLVAEYFGCESTLIDSPDDVARVLHEAARAIGATVVSAAFHRYSPHGVSGTLLIAESHLSIHTWPEHGYAAVDIFTCGGLDPRPGFTLLEGRLASRASRYQEILRGLPEHVAEGRPLLPEDVVILGAPAARSSRETG
jgi:S-adenosylmethionine decarboxylase